jgi:hypothetical protein
VNRDCLRPCVRAQERSMRVYGAMRNDVYDDRMRGCWCVHPRRLRATRQAYSVRRQAALMFSSLVVFLLATSLHLTASSVCFIPGTSRSDPLSSLVDTVSFREVADESGIGGKQSIVRTSPNCVFPSWDEKLQRWDRGGFCMEETLTGGACIGDVDRDGHEDLYYPRMDGTDILFRNLGNGSFVDVTRQAQLQYSTIRSNGCIFFDLDNDGDEDLYVSTVGDARFYLFVNDGTGRFTEQAIERGLANQKTGKYRWTAGFTLAVADYDNDGDLDVVSTEWLPRLDASKQTEDSKSRRYDSSSTNARFFKNMGPGEKLGTFVDMTIETNVMPDTSSQFHRNRDSAMHQYCKKVSKQKLVHALEALFDESLPSTKAKAVIRAFQHEIKFLANGDLRQIEVENNTDSHLQINATSFSPDDRVLTISVQSTVENSDVQLQLYVKNTKTGVESTLYNTEEKRGGEKPVGLIRTIVKSNSDDIGVIVKCSLPASVEGPCILEFQTLLERADEHEQVERKQCDDSSVDSIFAKVKSPPFLIWSIEQMKKIGYSPYMIRHMIREALHFSRTVDDEKTEQMKRIQNKVTTAMKGNAALAENVQERMMSTWDINHAAPFPLVGHFQFAAKFADIDGDGWLDLIMSGDFGTSRMFWNQRNGTFASGHFHLVEDLYDNSMGATVGDYDLDGNLDIMFTSTSINEHDFADISKIASAAGLILKFRGNHLYRTRGTSRSFEDVTSKAGIRESGWGWGAFFFDFDNDGDLDIINGNGMDDPETTDDDFAINQPMRLYVNQGKEQNFSYLEEAGIRGISSLEENRGAFAWDYDADGDLDVFVVNHASRPQLFRNEGGNYYDYLRVKVYTFFGSEAVGARITVQPYEDDDSHIQIQEIGSSGAFLGEGERTAHFGLGKMPEDSLVYKVTIKCLGKTPFFQHIFSVPIRSTVVATCSSQNNLSSSTNVTIFVVPECNETKRKSAFVGYRDSADDNVPLDPLKDSVLEPSFYGHIEIGNQLSTTHPRKQTGKQNDAAVDTDQYDGMLSTFDW